MGKKATIQKPTGKIAKNKSEWLELVKADLRKWNENAHNEDQLCLDDWISERYGDVLYGWLIVREDDGIDYFNIERA